MPKSIRLIITYEGNQTEIGGRKWLAASATDLVQAARGRFLPRDAVPYRLMRDGRPIAFFDPAAPLCWAGPRDGDVLEVVVDKGQQIDFPSFLYVLRELETAKRQIIEDANAQAFEAGLDPIDLSNLLQNVSN